MSWDDLHTLLTDDINSLFPTINAQKSKNANVELGETNELKVFVVPGPPEEGQMLTREIYEDVLTYDIVVLKRPGNGGEAEENNIINTAEDIRVKYTGRPIGKYRFHKSMAITLYDYSKLQNSQQIVSAVTVMFKEWRANGS